MSYLFKRSFVAYPLFGYFLAVMLGTVFANINVSLRIYANYFAWFAVFFVIVDFSLKAFRYFGLRVDFVRVLSRFFYVVALFCFCVFLFYVRVEENKSNDLSPSEVEIVGEVLEISKNRNATTFGVLKIQNSSIEILKNAQIWFTFANNKHGKQHTLAQIKRGDVIKVFGVVRAVHENQPSTWGYIKDKFTEASFNKYLLSRFIYYKIFASPIDVKVCSKSAESNVGYYIAEYIKESLSKSCISYVVDDTELKGALKAMLLGDKSNLSAEQKQVFNNTGAMHVFAVSGLHVGAVGGVLFWICSLCRIGMRWRALFVLPVLFMYVLSCGCSASAVRAYIMVSSFIVAISFSRGSRSINALMFSAIVATLYSPKIIFSAGFQLSYAVVAMLLLYASVYKNFEQMLMLRIYQWRYSTILRYVFRFIFGGLCVSLGASCVSLPIISYWFGSFSVSGIFISPVLVLLASIAVACGIVGVLLPSVLGVLANSIALICILLMSLIAVFVSDNFPMLWNVNIANGYLVSGVVVGVLLLAGMLENSNVWLRFIFVPLSSFSVMLILWIL